MKQKSRYERKCPICWTELRVIKPGGKVFVETKCRHCGWKRWNRKKEV